MQKALFDEDNLHHFGDTKVNRLCAELYLGSQKRCGKPAQSNELILGLNWGFRCVNVFGPGGSHYTSSNCLIQVRRLSAVLQLQPCLLSLDLKRLSKYHTVPLSRHLSPENTGGISFVALEMFCQILNFWRYFLKLT